MRDCERAVCFLLLGLVGLLGAQENPPVAGEESPRERLERLEILELTGGDLDVVIDAYRELAREASAPDAVRARASWKVALIEKARGNLEAALAALEEVLARAPEDAAERELAERALDGLRRGDAIAGIHDWYDDLVANETIRAELFRLATELLSPDARRRRDAGRSLRAYGKIALPVLRGALRSAGGAGRLALAEVAVAIGDWTYLGDLAAAADRQSFEEFLAGIAEWPEERREALRRFVTASPDAPAADVVAEVVAALDAPPGSADDDRAPADPCAALEELLPETVQKTFDGVHVVTRVAPEQRRALVASFDACLESQLAESRRARVQLLPRLRRAYEHLVADAVAGDDGVERFAALLEEIFELGLPPGVALLDLPAESHPRATPPSPARIALWERLLERTPPTWRQTVFLTVACDLPWRPELVANLATWLREPVAASGDPETDMAHYRPILEGLERLETGTLDSGEAPGVEAAETFARFRREVVLLAYQDFASALAELDADATGSLEAGPAERWLAQYKVSRRSFENRTLAPLRRLASYRLMRVGFGTGFLSVRRPGYARGYLEVLAESDYGIAFVAPRIPTSLLQLGGLPRREDNEFQRELLRGIISPDFADREIAVLAAAHALDGAGSAPAVPLGRARDIRLPEARDLLARGDRVTLADLLESAGDSHGSGRSSLGARRRARTARSPSDDGRPDDLLRDLAAFVREAVEDAALPVEIRQRAFAAVRIASLESLTVIAGALGPTSSQDERLVTRASSASEPLPDWFLALPPEERPAAVRMLAARGGALRELAIVLAPYLAPAAEGEEERTASDGSVSIPETERLAWMRAALADEATELDSFTVTKLVDSLYRHDLPETGEILRLLAERPGTPRAVQAERDALLLEKWTERARTEKVGGTDGKEGAR